MTQENTTENIQETIEQIRSNVIDLLRRMERVEKHVNIGEGEEIEDDISSDPSPSNTTIDAA